MLSNNVSYLGGNTLLIQDNQADSGGGFYLNVPVKPPMGYDKPIYFGFDACTV